MSDKLKNIKEKRKEKVAAVKSKIKNAIDKKKSKQTNPNAVTQNRLELLVTIVNKSKSEYYIDLIQSFDVNMQFVVLARGTADERIRSYIGMTDSDKTVIFSVIQEKKIADAMGTLEEKFNAIKNGKGIAFTVPFSSVIGTLIYGFLSDNRMAVKTE